MLNELVIATVGLGGGSETGILTHSPRSAGVHTRIDASGERVLARCAELDCWIPVGERGRPVHRLDREARLRASFPSHARDRTAIRRRVDRVAGAASVTRTANP